MTNIDDEKLRGIEELWPDNSLPDWSDSAVRVRNSDFITKRVAEGGYGAEPDSLLATQLHRFIYEYDYVDPYRSAWFLHRLELVLTEAAATYLHEVDRLQAEIAAKDKILDQHIAGLRSVAWAITDKACGGISDIVAEAARVRAEAEKYRSAREKVAEFILAHGFATGHGDTIDDLLLELGGQLAECRRDAARLDKVEAQMLAISPYSGGGWVIETDAPTGGDDFQEIRLYEGRGTLREAIDSALAAAKETSDDPRD